MKVANTRKVNDRITQYLEREELNNLIGMGISAPVSMDEIVFDDYADLKNYADAFKRNMKADGIE